MKKLLLFLTFCGILTSCTSMKAVQTNENIADNAEKQIITMDKDLLAIYVKKGDYTGAQLRKLAIENEIIPKDVDVDYFKKHRKERNTAAIWIVYSREEKLSLIDSYKRIFNFRGAVISKDSNYYVDRINNILYQRITKGQFEIARDKGVINIFKTIAILEGDYNDGRKKVVILRQWLGEEGFEAFREKHPQRYKDLLKMSM